MDIDEEQQQSSLNLHPDDVLVSVPRTAEDMGIVSDREASQMMEEDNSNDSGSGVAARKASPQKPRFAALTVEQMSNGVTQFRRIPIPPHRMSPLRDHWMAVYSPLVEHMKLQVRMNLKTKSVELKTSPHTQDIGALQKGADFVRAFALGFDVDDSLALLRLDDLYIDTFEIKDVKTLNGDHLSRAIGRIAGKDGKTKFGIENATRTRIVLADQKIHILGSFANIKLARDAVVSLILGSPPGKVYGHLRTVAARMHERF